MYTQIVTFRLQHQTDAEFRNVCEQLAPAFANIPGLLAKLWLANPETNTGGGVYLWRDRAAMDGYLKSDLFTAVATNRHFTGITSTGYEVLEGPSEVTHARSSLVGVAGTR